MTRPVCIALDHPNSYVYLLGYKKAEANPGLETGELSESLPITLSAHLSFKVIQVEPCLSLLQFFFP